MMPFLLSIFFLLLASCGNQKFPDYQEEEIIVYKERMGTFNGEFSYFNGIKPLNASTLVFLKDNQFYVKIIVKRGFRKFRVKQYLHKGSRCPMKSDDINHDGVIDATEVLMGSGEILIPLDGFLQEQKKGYQYFPVTDKRGFYYYSRSASVSKMMIDLYSEDTELFDGITKLSSSEKLSLNERVIILYGTPQDPMRPVACARLKEVSYSVSNSSE